MKVKVADPAATAARRWTNKAVSAEDGTSTSTIGPVGSASSIRQMRLSHDGRKPISSLMDARNGHCPESLGTRAVEAHGRLPLGTAWAALARLERLDTGPPQDPDGRSDARIKARHVPRSVICGPLKLSHCPKP